MTNRARNAQPVLPADNPPVHVTLLSTVAVKVGDRAVRLTQQQQQLLAASLFLAAGNPIPTDKLIDQIWDDPPENARELIQKLVLALRNALDEMAQGIGRRVIRHQSGCYLAAVHRQQVDSLRLRDRLDEAVVAQRDGDQALAMEHYQRAVEIWGASGLAQAGEPLAGLTGRWADAMRQGLRNTRDTALLGWLRIGLARGDHDRLLLVLTDATAAFPYEQSLAAMFMLALYRSGRQTAALSEYDRLDGALAHLGFSPDNRIRDLRQRILTEDPSLDLPANEAEDVTAEEPAAGETAAGGSDQEEADRGTRQQASGTPSPTTVHNVTKVRDVFGGSGPMAIGTNASVTPSTRSE